MSVRGGSLCLNDHLSQPIKPNSFIYVGKELKINNVLRKNLNPILSEVIRHENNNRYPWAYCEILGDVFRIMIG